MPRRAAGALLLRAEVGVPIGTGRRPSPVTSRAGSFPLGLLAAACVVLLDDDVSRSSLLSALVFLLPLASRAEDSPVLGEAKALMQEGLERELPAPTVKGPPQWPAAAERPAAAQERGRKLEALGERVRNEASLRARAAAEERRAAPENQQGVGQARTRAAKSLGPPDKKPRGP